MGSYHCRNMLLDNCYFDRFDSHYGLHSATIKRSTIGFGIHVIGGGTLRIEDTERLSGLGFISLRNDYNGIFNGDIVVKGCTVGKDLSVFLYATWREFHNGLDAVMTRSINIDGLRLHSDDFTLFKVNGATRDALTNKINPLTLPHRVSVKDIYLAAEDGERTFRPAVSCFDDAFSDIRINFQD